MLLITLLLPVVFLSWQLLLLEAQLSWLLLLEPLLPWILLLKVLVSWLLLLEVLRPLLLPQLLLLEALLPRLLLPPLLPEALGRHPPNTSLLKEFVVWIGPCVFSEHIEDYHWMQCDHIVTGASQLSSLLTVGFSNVES